MNIVEIFGCCAKLIFFVFFGFLKLFLDFFFGFFGFYGSFWILEFTKKNDFFFSFYGLILKLLLNVTKVTTGNQKWAKTAYQGSSASFFSKMPNRALPLDK